MCLKISSKLHDILKNSHHCQWISFVKHQSVFLKIMFKYLGHCQHNLFNVKYWLLNWTIFFESMVLIRVSNLKTVINKKTPCVVTIAIICSNLASLWKFQYFRRPIYNPVKHLWRSFYWKNSKLLSIFIKKLHRRCLLGF